MSDQPRYYLRITCYKDGLPSNPEKGNFINELTPFRYLDAALAYKTNLLAKIRPSKHNEITLFKVIDFEVREKDRDEPPTQA